MFFFGGGVRGVGLGGQGGCERRIQVFCENSNKKLGGVGGGGGGLGRGSGLGGQGGCERRIDVFGKIHKKWGGGGVGRGSGWWVRLDVNEELKFL